MKNRTMVDYVDRVHEENERLRRENRELRARLAAEQLDCGKWEVLADRRYARCGRAIDLAVMYRDSLAAVKARCEGNNWGGTAKMCGEGE